MLVFLCQNFGFRGQNVSKVWLLGQILSTFCFFKVKNLVLSQNVGFLMSKFGLKFKMCLNFGIKVKNGSNFYQLRSKFWLSGQNWSTFCFFKVKNLVIESK